MVGKKSYPCSLIAAYSVKDRKLSKLLSILIMAIIVVVVVLFSFWPVKQVISKELGQDVSGEVDQELAQNLQWLNKEVLVLKEVKRAHPVKHNPIPVVHKNNSYHVSPSDNKRLNASSLIFSKKEKANVLSHMRHVEHGGVLYRRLMAGEVLHAVLESAIQTDFAGPIRAILSEPSYSYQGMRLLLPAGTRLIGQYQNTIAASQVRVGIQWQRLILPDGSSVTLDAPGVDAMGRVGLRATRVNSHFWKRFGEASLYSLLSAGSQLSGGVGADSLTAGQLLRSQVASSFASTAMSSLDKDKDIPPTIYLDPGSEVSVFVRRDIEF